MKLWVLLAQATGLTLGRQTLLPAGKHSPRRQAGAGTRAVFSRGAGRRCCRVDLAWSPAAFREDRELPRTGGFWLWTAHEFPSGAAVLVGHRAGLRVSVQSGACTALRP